MNSLRTSIKLTGILSTRVIAAVQDSFKHGKMLKEINLTPIYLIPKKKTLMQIKLSIVILFLYATIFAQHKHIQIR